MVLILPILITTCFIAFIAAQTSPEFQEALRNLQSNAEQWWSSEMYDLNIAHHDDIPYYDNETPLPLVEPRAALRFQKPRKPILHPRMRRDPNDPEDSFYLGRHRYCR
jgi:hypothetical protein